LSSALAIFGGTFDPVHFGHLRSAAELVQRLDLAALRFMPAAAPPHREAPVAAGEHRAAMLELAIADNPCFSCDRRELLRRGPSYTVLSLRELRAELGPERPLCFVLGADALAGLPTWYHWQELLDLAHLVAVARPGWQWPQEGLVADLIARHGVDPPGLADAASGGLCIQRLTPQPISATAVRALLQSGRSAQGLVPDSVLAYIRRHGLYSSH
jgi:nicotinate-nucleotide adenylyltransferase